MAGFLNIHNSEYAATGVAEYNAQIGNGRHTFLGYTLATNLPSLFMGLTEKIAEKSDGKGGAEKSEESESSQKQLKKLETQLNDALAKIGASDGTQINEAVAKAQEECQTKIAPAQTLLNNINAGTDEYSIKIAKLKQQLGTGLEALNNKNAATIKIQIDNLETQKAKAKSEAEKVIKTETAKLKEIQENAENAYKIYQKYAELAYVGEDNNYVKETKESLHEFNNQRTIFLTSTNPAEKKAAAKKIKDMAEDSNNKDNNSIQATYKLLKNRIETCLK